MNDHRYNPALHRIAVVTAVATFPLIFMGGLVTSHQAGMSVPDWPNSYGYNMFLFPPNQWVGGILYEHTHRLMGTAVGFCSVLLALFAWGPGRNEVARRWLFVVSMIVLAMGILCAAGPLTYNNHEALTGVLRQAAVVFFGIFLVLLGAYFARSRDERRWVRWLAVGVLVSVIVQGILGGLRVVLVELDLAIVHACFAQAFFCLTALMAAVTSRWWTEVESTADTAVAHAPVLSLAVTAVGLIYLQLIAGATMRHYEAGLAIPDLPLAYGQLLPPTTASELSAINQWRAWQFDAALQSVTLAQVWLHFAHRLGAVAVSAAVIALVVRIFRHHRTALLTRLAVLLALLLVAQLTLGVLTVLWRKPADIASLHVAVGALTLFTAFTIAVRCARLANIAAPRRISARLEAAVPENLPEAVPA